MAAEVNKTLVRELRDRLAATLEYAAAEVPFYRSRTDLSGRDLGLNDFPLMNRFDIDKNLGQLIVANRFPDYVITSSGTIGEPLAMTMRVEEEYEAVHKFLTGYGPRDAPALDEIQEFVLDLYLNTNGYFRRKAAGWPTVSIPIERPAHADLVRRLIVNGLELGGYILPAGRVQCQVGVLRTLTAYFVVTGFEPAGHAIHSVTGYGGHLSRIWRRRLEEIWGASIESRYGLSEFTVGNAVKCSWCGALHYLTAWPEFLSLRNRTPVERGDAELVLTSLLPFVTVQPRIRYVTGDLVTVTALCERTGLPGFHFRGRRVSSVWVRAGAVDRVLFSEIDVGEVLDQFNEIGVRRHTAEIQLWDGGAVPPPPFPVGAPQFRIKAGEVPNASRGITLDAEVVFVPADNPRRAAEISDAITAAVLTELQGNAGATDTSEIAVAVNLVAPGGLR